MVNPTRHRQLEELDTVNLCTQMLFNARNELYLNMRFLDILLNSLGFEAEPSRSLRTDGYLIYYDPDLLILKYNMGRIMVNRAYLHMLFHCLFCHLDTRGKRAKEYWNLACDIAVEAMIDGLGKKCVHISASMVRRELYQRLKKELPVLTAGGIYKALQQMNMSEKRYQLLAAEFYTDSHEQWEEEDDPKARIQRQNMWEDNREKIQTEMETSGQDSSEDSGNLMEQLQVENRERYDYKQFLRKFSVWKEELQMDEDSFDYGFYTYGFTLYGNMPLLEPLETREVNRIEDFVIVIDTSMSCSGGLIRQFLEETYEVLCESESYFRKINVHIIQCDDAIRSDQLIKSSDELEAYMEQFSITGGGGTDFRPAFDYVNGLMAAGSFKKLKGMIYFTDGCGIYPVKMPAYDTVFVFMKDHYSDEAVPPWAMKLIISPDELEGMAADEKQGD